MTPEIRASVLGAARACAFQLSAAHPVHSGVHRAYCPDGAGVTPLSRHTQ